MSLTKVSYSMIQGEVYNVLDFGAVGDGVADDTAAIQAAIDATTGSSNQVWFPLGDYKITSTLDLSNKPLTLVGESYLGKSPRIFGDFDGYLVNASGDSISAYSEPYYISSLFFQNTNNGSALNSAGCLKLFYMGTSRIENCSMQAQGTCVYMLEAISTNFDNCHLTGDSGTNPNLYSRGYAGQGRNTRVNGGRVYGCFIAFDIAGDSWVISQNNAEFNYGIIIRTGGISGLLVEGCHFETSSMVWSNAQTLPTTTTTPWTDNGGDGTGWSGGVTFLNTHVAIGSGTNGIRAPIFVIKSQSGYQGDLQLIGCDFTVASNLATISDSFNSSATKTMVSGTGVFISATTGFIAPAVIPVDQYSMYVNFSPASQGTNSGLVSGVAKYQLNDSSCYLDASNGTALHGYTTVSLLSTYYSRGVQFVSDAFVPTVDNTISLGSAPYRWSQVYAANGTINTSDANQKQQFASLTEAEKATAKLIKGLIKTFKFNESVKEKGDAARIHVGVVAQEVKKAFADNGLDADNYGLFCSDTWYVVDGKTRDEKGIPFTSETPNAKAVTQLGIRYEQLLAFIIASI